MSYHSSALLILEGTPKDMEDFCDYLKGLSKAISIRGHKNQCYENILELGHFHEHCGQVIFGFKREWFKAYSDWADSISTIRAYCEEHDIIYNYARFGENFDDIEVGYAPEEEGPEIGVKRTFWMSDVYKEVLKL